MTATTARSAACPRALLWTARLAGALLGASAMLVTLAWLWSAPSVPRMGLTWVGWCVGMRLWAVAVGETLPRWAYVAALAPAASPFVVVLLVYAVWAPLAA